MSSDITLDQLHVYVVGYEELTGQRADLVEVLNLDERANSRREVVNDDLLSGIRTKIQRAGDDLRSNHLPRLRSWCGTCDRCDLAGLCRNRQRRSSYITEVSLNWFDFHGLQLLRPRLLFPEYGNDKHERDKRVVD